MKSQEFVNRVDYTEAVNNRFAEARRGLSIGLIFLDLDDLHCESQVDRVFSGDLDGSR